MFNILNKILSFLPFNGKKTEIAGVLACLMGVADIIAGYHPEIEVVREVLTYLASLVGYVGVTHKVAKAKS